jgi:creatinine amidohydrolase
MISAISRQTPRPPSKSRASIDLLAYRSGMLADVAWQLLTSSIHFAPIDRLESRRIVITGAGASEGAARYLAALLRNQLALNAGFMPVSAFIEPQRDHSDDVLIVFSQGISPNARIVLNQCKRFGMSVLLTGIHPEGRSDEAKLVAELRREGMVVYVLPPEDESGTVVRILGPVIASLAGALMAQTFARRLGAPWPEEPLAALPDKLASARGRAEEAIKELDPEWAFRRWAFVTCGDYGELCHGLRWKWMEGLMIAMPPIWDVLQITHGRFERLFAEPITLVALERENGGIDTQLYDNLEASLVPGRHTLVRLRSCMRGHYSYFDHDAQSNWMLLRALEARPLDLVSFPGKGSDAPLVGLAVGRKGA